MELEKKLQEAMRYSLEKTQELRELLVTEQEALQQDNQKKINELTHKKQKLLVSVLDANKMVIALISHPTQQSQSKLQDIIHHLNSPNEKQLIALYKKLKDTVSETLNLNSINGIALNSRANSIKHTLSLLTTGHHQDHVVSYNAQGSLQSSLRTTGQSKA
jgi:flagellar biosynthesis/type III secretory pathway chaperone